MKRIAATAVMCAISMSLQGCWFIFIPGSVTGAISDAITGDEGNNCVPANAKVGDTIRMPSGGTGIIKSLSGKSMRCTESDKPIRALITPA